jgi:hypothetical protein
MILHSGSAAERQTSQKLLDEVERRLVIMATQHSGHLRTAYMFVRGATATELLHSKYSPHPRFNTT